MKRFIYISRGVRYLGGKRQPPLSRLDMREVIKEMLDTYKGAIRDI